LRILENSVIYVAMKKIKWLTEAVLLIIIGLPLAVMPLRAARYFGACIGLVFFYLFSGRRKIALENIMNTIAAGGLTTNELPEELVKKTFMNFGKSFAEIVKLYYGLGGKMIQAVAVNGKENFYAAQAKNRGMLMITGHCGNWELLSITFGNKFGKVYIIERPLDNIYLHKIISKVRTFYGNYLIDKKGAVRGLLNAVKHNSTVGVLIDQASNREEGFMINFLGRKAWATKMPALIAAKSNIPIVPAFIHREGDKHIIDIYPELQLLNQSDEISLQKDTQMISDTIADYIRQYPTEWLWTHRRWKRT
jgi:Kdo2-lipid IVA lauroyltransferase/acyltransferase